MAEQDKPGKPSKDVPEAKPKDPMSYTDNELEAMRIDKKFAGQYRDIMRFRKKVIREKKAEDAEKNVFPPGETIDRLRKEQPRKYADLVKTMGAAVKKQLEHNLATSTSYPPDTVRDWRMAIRASERGLWHPKTPQMGAWRPPKQKSAYDKFMSS